MKPMTNGQMPMWARKEFRTLVIVAVMGLSVVAVLIFEIGPALKSRPAAEEKAFELEAAIPPSWKTEAPVVEKAEDRVPLDTRDEAYLSLVKNVAKEGVAGALEVDYRIFAKAPERARGRAVKLTALYLDSTPLRVQPEGADVEFIHRTYLSNLNGTEGYVVDLLQVPASFEKRDPVTVDARFLRLAMYEGRKGPVTAPHLVAKGLTKVTEPVVAGAAWNSEIMMMSVVGGSAAALVAWMSYRIVRRVRARSRGIAPFVPTRG